MSQISPINIPCITNVLVGIDTETGQMYYSTSGSNNYQPVNGSSGDLSGYIPITGVYTDLSNDKQITLLNDGTDLITVKSLQYGADTFIDLNNGVHEIKLSLENGIYYKKSGIADTYFNITNYYDNNINAHILDINISGDTNQSIVGLNGHLQNTSGSFVILDEQGNLPSGLTENLIKSNQANSVTSGFNLNYIENTKQTNYSVDNIGFHDDVDMNKTYNIISISGISMHYNTEGYDDYTEISPGEISIGAANMPEQLGFSYNVDDGLKLNGNSTNTPSGLAVLDQNGFIIDNQLLQVKVNDYGQEGLPTEYEISGGIYQCFTIGDDEESAQFTQLTLTTPNGDEHYTNENKYGFIRFYCGSDIMSLGFPPKARLLNIPTKFKSGNLYLIKYLKNTFEIFEMIALEISDDYVVGPGITVECEEGEVFSNVTVQDGGQLKFAATSATLNDLTVESGGILSYDLINTEYDPVNYSLLQGSNTNIASGTIYTNGTVANGYCENGTFKELDGFYRLGVGSNITVIEPKISYGLYSAGENPETGEPIFESKGARVYGFNGAIISGASIGILGDINTYFGAIATNTVLGGYSGERSACELTVWSGGSAVNTIVSSNGYLNATYNGYVNSAIIYSGGSCNIHTNNDKVHDNIIVMPYGYYRQYGSYTVSGTTYFSNTIVNSLTISAGSGSAGANVIIHSGGTVNNLTLYKEGETVDNGEMCRIYGGVVSTLRNDRYYDDREETDTSLILNSNGYVKNIFVDFKPGLNIIINSGRIDNYEKAGLYAALYSENDVVIIRNGTINTYNRNFGNSTTISNGGLIQSANCNYNQKIIISSGGSINSIYLDNPEYSGTSAISSVGGSPTLIISSGGQVDTINVNYGGVSTYGSINTVNQTQGYVIVSRNAIVSTAYTNGRDFHVRDGGTVNNLTVSAGSGAFIFNSGIVSSCTVIGSTAILKVSNGGIVNNLTMSRGKLSTFANASITNLYISSGTGGSATYTMSGTSITNMTIDLAGGSTFNTTIDYLNANKGYIDARSNTIISSADINCRDFILRTGATVSSATYTNNRHGSGAIKVSSGCTINNFTYNGDLSYDDKYPTGQLTIYNGGIVSNCAFTNFVVSSGGTMVNNQAIFIPEVSMKGEHVFGQGIIESGGTGLNINCKALYYEQVSRWNIYDVHLNVGAYVSGYNVTGLEDITISSGTTVFNMSVSFNEHEHEGHNGTITVESGGYINYISAHTWDEGANTHNLIVKSGGTALNVVRKMITEGYEPTLNVTSETGAVVTYIDEN